LQAVKYHHAKEEETEKTIDCDYEVAGCVGVEMEVL